MPEAGSNRQQILEQLIAMAQPYLRTEGRNQTPIPYLSIVRYSRETPLTPGVLTPSFCLILQGAKRLYLGENMLDYRAGDYLTSVIDIPASAQTVDVSPEHPYLGLRIDFTTMEIASVLTEAEIQIQSGNAKLAVGAAVGQSDAELLDIFVRLLKLLDKPGEVRFMYELVKREMIFKLLTGSDGHLFIQQGLFERQEDGIGKAIEWIRDHFATSFTVEELAKLHNLSVSSLHHKFKAVTTMGPLQYQKQFRLQEARRLLLSGSKNVTAAAMEVGYESPSQFSREYRRLFGQPPLKDMKAIRQGSSVSSVI